jgi:hypothetical protein
MGIWTVGAIETPTEDAVEVIDYSEMVVFDAFNNSYLSSLDYRGLLLHHDCQKMFHFLHTTIHTMCTAKKVNLKLEAKAPLRCRLS